MNRISFLNRGYAFKGLLAVLKIFGARISVCTCIFFFFFFFFFFHFSVYM